MKKVLLFGLLLCGSAATTAAHAQARAGGNLTSKDYTGGAVTDSRNTGFGVKGGFNLTNLHGDGKGAVYGRDNLNTFHAGVYGQFGFNEFSSVQVELLYSRKGYRTEQFPNPAGGNYSERDVRLDYLSLPVLFVGNITETLSFHVGPQVSLLTKVNSGGENLALDANGYNSLDFGGVIGAEARLGPARVGVRYDYGLGKIYKDGTVVRYNNQPVYTINDTNIRNQTFQAYIGIGFTQ